MSCQDWVTYVTLPPLPATVQGILGPIAVEVVPDLKDEGKPLFGEWDGMARLIRIRAGMELRTQWLTLWHEHCHAILWECGVALEEEDEESVCDALALGRVAAMQQC